MIPTILRSSQSFRVFFQLIITYYSKKIYILVVRCNYIFVALTLHLMINVNVSKTYFLCISKVKTREFSTNNNTKDTRSIVKIHSNPSVVNKINFSCKSIYKRFHTSILRKPFHANKLNFNQQIHNSWMFGIVPVCIYCMWCSSRSWCGCQCIVGVISNSIGIWICNNNPYTMLFSHLR